MTSSITVWTSPSTAHAQARVAQIINATRGAEAVYDSVSIAKCDVEECRELFDGAFRRLVSLTMPDPTLHIVAVIPMYEDSTAIQIQTLYDACLALEHNKSLHILGLATAIGAIFDSKGVSLDSSRTYKDNCRLLSSLCTTASFSVSYSLIDDFAENGAPIGFTIESLSRYVASIQVALMQDYYGILNPALLTAHTGDNISIGISSLSFNRQAAIGQILGLAFLEALDNVGINDNEVDAQKAAREAESFLAEISDRYPEFYDKQIRPLYVDKGYDEGKVVAAASSMMDAEMVAMKDEILDLLRCDTLSLPEKEAVLALILGRDNANIRGMQYEHEGALLDDACELPINLYVKAFNKCCKESGYLPKRGDFKALKKYVWNDASNTLEESPENLEALNPLPDIKRLKQEIINTTSFIRDKQDELNDLLKSVRQRKEADEIKNKWRKPEGKFKDIEYKEQPLSEQYTPSPGLVVKDSVDMRTFFPPVKNQLNLGSCTSFAAVSMYEALMAQAGVQGDNNMSPAFLYYHSNILKGKPAGGSNFYEQLEVLGTHGVCHEELYIYDAASPATKPSVQAEEDAKNHRVIVAKQIPLVDEVDKPDTLNRNHLLLTSALSEGYPIGISLRVYDNLGQDGAFVLHPDDAPDAKEDGWHAMVIVGYSEENNFYIVRNSWGVEFGENGYCYIPTAYIDDPDYMNFACIITEISDNAAGGKADVPTVIADFEATETEIRIATIRNAITKIRVSLKNSQTLYAEYYRYYQRLVVQLTMPKIQNKIRSAAETVQTIHYQNVEGKKRQLEDSFVRKLKDYKKNLQKIIFALFAVALVLGVTCCFIQSYITIGGFFIAAGLFCLSMLGYKWWMRIKRRNLQDELNEVAMDLSRQATNLLEMQIRFHVAGMWLRRFHNLSTDIGNIHDRLVSYNSTLRAWQENYSRRIGAPEIPEGQMFRIIDATPLLSNFFSQNKSNIIRDIDLIKLFEDYQVNSDKIEEYHKSLQDKISSVIYSLMSDFNIVNFLLGDRYSYLNPVNFKNEISDMVNVGQPSYRNRKMNATPAIFILMADVIRTRANGWKSTVMLQFPTCPILTNFSDPTVLLLVTLHPQSVE